MCVSWRLGSGVDETVQTPTRFCSAPLLSLGCHSEKSGSHPRVARMSLFRQTLEHLKCVMEASLKT